MAGFLCRALTKAFNKNVNLYQQQSRWCRQKAQSRFASDGPLQADRQRKAIAPFLPRGVIPVLIPGFNLQQTNTGNSNANLKSPIYIEAVVRRHV